MRAPLMRDSAPVAAAVEMATDARLDGAIARSARALRAAQRADGPFVFELEAD
jgi:hypothetical protein